METPPYYINRCSNDCRSDGCNSKKQKFEFDHAQEAIAACHQELAMVKDQKDATIDELVARINIWQELQDSTLTLMVRIPHSRTMPDSPRSSLP